MKRIRSTPRDWPTLVRLNCPVSLQRKGRLNCLSLWLRLRFCRLTPVLNCHLVLFNGLHCTGTGPCSLMTNTARFPLTSFRNFCETLSIPDRLANASILMAAFLTYLSIWASCMSCVSFVPLCPKGALSPFVLHKFVQIVLLPSDKTPSMAWQLARNYI